MAKHKVEISAVTKEHPLVLDFVLSAQWAIKQEALVMMMDIVKRGGNEKLAESIRENRDYTKRYATVTPEGVGIIPIHGPLIPKASLFDEISGATNVAMLSRDFDALMSDPSVKSIVLDVDSPGGVVTGIDEFSQKVKAARGNKPVTAYVSGIGASAAYWILSAAERVVMSATAEVGSIGIMHIFMDDSEAMKAQGIQQIEIISSKSPKKNADPKTEAGRSEMQRRADDLYEVMAEAIAGNRGVSVKDVEDGFGEGGMLVARKAVERKMADSVMTFESLMEEESAKQPQQEGVPFMSGTASTATEIKTADALKAAFPSLCLELENAAIAKGVKSENDRQLALDTVPAKGYEELVASARKDVSVTKEGLAFSILQERDKREKANKDAHAADAQALTTAAETVVSGEPVKPEDAQKQVIAAMVEGANGKRKVHAVLSAPAPRQ